MRVSDTMNRTLLLIAGAAAIVGSAGCGGGGGGNSGPAAPTVNALRTLQPGDSWKYAVKADIVLATGAPTIHLKDGSYTRAIGTYVPGILQGAPGRLSLTETLALSYYGGFGVNENNVSNISQTSAGVIQYSDTQDISGNQEGAEPFDTNPLVENFVGSQQILPGAFNDSTGFGSDNSYGVPVFVPGTPAVLNPDGTIKTAAIPDKFIEKVTNQEHFALTVTGKEDIDTPAGKFSTFKCNVSSHYVTQGVTANGVAWWAPQLGSFVKESLTQNIPTVGTEHLEYTLSSYHLAPSAS